MNPELSQSEREQLAEILTRRAKDIAGFSNEHRETMPGSVEMALTREMKRLRRLAEKLNPPTPEPED